jgi:hypothetical protein
MPRSPITWSSAPFFWPSEPALDKKSLNSPQPCQHGVNCTYKKPGACCAFVHPGEQGTGRVLLPERTYVENGKEIYQPETVRLVGSSFYKRRRLGLSWPEWCQQEKSRSEPQALQGPFTISNGMVVPSQAESVQAYFNKMYQQLQDEAYTHSQESYALQVKEAEALLAQQYKQTLGNLIFAKVEPKLADMMKSASYSDETEEAMVWPGNMTAGKIVGMFLEAMELIELRSLINDEAYFEKQFNDAIGILHEHWETVNKPESKEWVCGRWVPIGTDPLEAC